MCNINLQNHACVCDHLLGKIDLENIYFEIGLNIYLFDHEPGDRLSYSAVDCLLVVGMRGDASVYLGSLLHYKYCSIGTNEQ